MKMLVGINMNMVVVEAVVMVKVMVRVLAYWNYLKRC